MKPGWAIKKLIDICEIQRGGSPRPIEQFLTTNSEGINWIKIGDTKNVTKYISETQFKIRPEGAKRSRMVYPGDFILSNSMSFGRPYIMNTTGCIHDGWLVLRPRDHNINQDFLYYVLGSDLIFQQFDRLAAGSTVRNLNINLVQRVEIPLPPLAEQQRIVRILDEAFASLVTASVKAEANRQNARALFYSQLEAIFACQHKDWAEKPLADLCDIKHGFPFRSKFFAGQGPYILLTPGNFYESGGYRDRGTDQKYYVGEVPSGYLLRQSELLVAMTEQAAGLLGSPILTPKSGVFLHNQRLGLVSRKPGVVWLNEFFFHVFNTKAVRSEIHASASGVKVRHTSPTKIGLVRVRFPVSMQEQDRIASNLRALHEETEQLQSLYRKKIAALDALKQSLLHQAFTGNL